MLSMIVAASLNNVIGKNNVMPWHLSEDLKQFKATTTGHKIVMGRKTFDSLGKALPNRTNLVLTRDPNFKAPGATVIHDISEVLILEQQNPTAELFVIGGSEIYRVFLPHVKRIHLTRIHESFEGDAFLPEISWNEFRQTQQTEILFSEKNNLKYQFLVFDRI